jgi:hypothetical protein
MATPLSMQAPTDNLYKFLAIFGLVVIMFSIYVPLLRYMEFSRLSHKADAIYAPMIEPLTALDDEARAELECTIHQAYLRDKQQPPKPDPCPAVSAAKSKGSLARAQLEKLQAQLTPIEVDRNSIWQEYMLLLYAGSLGLLVGIVMCISGFWLWYTRLQKYLDASVRQQAAHHSNSKRVRVSRRRHDA